MNFLSDDTKKEMKASKDVVPKKVSEKAPVKKVDDVKDSKIPAASPDSIKKMMGSEGAVGKKAPLLKKGIPKDSNISSNNPFLKKTEVPKKVESEKKSGQIEKSPPRRVKKVPIPQMPIKNGGRGRLSVNLVPEDTLRIVKKDLPNRLKFLTLFVILIFALLLFGWGVLSWLQITTFENMQTLKNSIAEKEIKIHTYKTQSSEIVKLRQRYDLIKVLLNNHVYWTKFFALLEKYTIDDVYYTSFSVKSDKNARITFNARGRNVEAIARQLKVLQDADDFIQDVRINGFSMLSSSERRSQNVSQSNVVSFDIIVTLDPDVFLLSQNKEN